MRTKLVLGLFFAVAAFLVAFMPSAAMGNGPGHASMNPQEANIPYLAWIGENVKLARTFDQGYFPGVTEQSVAGYKAAGYDVELAVMNWTGDPFYKPTVINGTLDVSGIWHGSFMDVRFGGLYASGVVVNDHPGIAKIKMFVTKQGDVVLEQVFEVAWMNLLKPTIHEMSNDDLAALSNDQPSLGDPKGDGVFMPLPADDLLLANRPTGDNAFGLGYVQVGIKGTFPFPNAAGLMTMPDDWAALASDPIYGAVTKEGPDPMAWDIHSDPIPQTWVSGLTDYMSPLFGDSMKIGPFDPLVADMWKSTVIRDGNLDAYDAPMPADRIDFTIGAGGVGTFATVDKSDVYVLKGSHHWDGDSFVSLYRDHWEYLYAPFYKAFIPATARGDGSSGVYAVRGANGDFPPFLVKQNPYDFWTQLNKQVSDARHDADLNTCLNELGVPRPSPSGTPKYDDHGAKPASIDTVSVYTDEHGEAIVAFDPDAGFYFTADSYNRCDLGDGSAPVLLGTATIQATAIYPYEQSAGGSITSDPLTKQVFGDPMKKLTFVAQAKNEAIVTETIHDIYGNPIENAVVKFSSDPAEQMHVDTGTLVDSHTGWISVKTDENGQAAVDVIASKGTVDVTAENLGTSVGGHTGVLRDMLIDFSGAMPKIFVAPVTPVTPQAPTITTIINNSGGGGGGSSSTTTNVTTNVTPPSSTETVTTNVVSPSGVTKVLSAKVVSAKLVVAKLTGKKAVYVKVTSAAKKVTVKVKLLAKSGKILKTVNISVATNKLVKLGLTVPKLARSVTAGVVR